MSTELPIIGEQLSPGQTHGIAPYPGSSNPSEGPVGFFDPIVAMETVEEVRAVRLVRTACAALNLAAFEWTIASGLVRCGSDVGGS